jgi:predicted phage terminase large subunit-like protein
MPRLKKDIALAGLTTERVSITPDLLSGFVQLYLMDRLDGPKTTPQFHRDMWEAYCNIENPLVAIAAPRGHAKSTAGTLAFCLASILFGAQDFVLIIGATELLASGQLKDIATELRENEAITDFFKVSLLIDNETEIQGTCGGRVFRIVAKGAMQGIRGVKWRHKRPGLILIDDLENDEAVENPERRIKLREWVDNAVIPLGSDIALIRAVGTILHFDSWLERCLTLPGTPWVGLRFKAHEGFDDFSNILWPEKFPEKRLRLLRGIYMSNHNASGYSREYLSHPIAEIDAYFRRTDFPAMLEADYDKAKNYYIGIDFAISKADRANKTSMVVGGLDSDNILHIVDRRTDRWDTLEIIDEMFRLNKEYEPDFFILEKGMLEKSIGPVLNLEMLRRGTFFAIVTITPTQDKTTRTRPMQARMRAQGVRFDRKAEWFQPYQQQLLEFPRSGKDDDVDATALLGLHLDSMQSALSVEELAEQEWDEEMQDSREDGRNHVTGY